MKDGGVVARLRINAGRLQQRIGELAQVGAIPGTTGCARLALTDDDRRGRDLVVAWMRDLDLDVRIDAIGNVLGVARGADDEDAAPVVIGSHIDTVRTGGRYDGNYGVLSGLEVIETLRERRVMTRRPLAVAFFTGEEGARFAPDMLGSLVFAGGMTVEAARDIVGIDGATVGEELDRIGYAGALPCPMLVPHAYLELHIEQGPVLEAEGATIGVVTGVQGISWQELVIEGESNHAGTTPITMRHDAALVAARIATFVRDFARHNDGYVATIGRLELHPNLVNVVAARATLTVDLRHPDDARLTDGEARLASFVREAAAEEGVAVRSRTLARFAPVAFDARLVDLVERHARLLGHSCRRIASGAGHDAQMLARLCPSSMIFVPSQRGVSHNVTEHTDTADLEAGANVLLHAALELTEEAA